MEVNGKGGVLVSLSRRMGWVCGRILGRFGRSSLINNKFQVGDGSNVRFW
jgi:hypothetical protein